MSFILIVLSGFAFYMVVLAVKKIVNNRKHITEAEFRAYMKGARTMSDDDRSRITSHLGICDDCQAEVEAWIKG